jgi:hypothetical protein
VQTPAMRVNITVHANGVEGGAVNISAVPVDSSISHSLISTDYARATHGSIVQTGTVLSLRDADGKVYTSSSYITLRWWYSGDSLSNTENFYITSDLPSHCGAMLRQPQDNVARGNKVLPLFNKVQTAGAFSYRSIDLPDHCD